MPKRTDETPDIDSTATPSGSSQGDSGLRNSEQEKLLADDLLTDPQLKETLDLLCKDEMAGPGSLSFPGPDAFDEWASTIFLPPMGGADPFEAGGSPSGSGTKPKGQGGKGGEPPKK